MTPAIPDNFTPSLIVGVGNRYRSDDAVGLVVANKLAGQLPASCRLVSHGSDGATLIELRRAEDRVLIVDAVNSGGQAGTVYELDALANPVPSQFFNYSTHAFSVAEGIEVARSLGRLPAGLFLIGIEGENFRPGENLSQTVKAATNKTIQRIVTMFE